jgi:hypothetical protein
MLVAMAGIAVFLLPSEVNSWAYAASAENQDTFNPVSYGPVCISGVPHRGCLGLHNAVRHRAPQDSM